MIGSCDHSGLLWGLERLAWNPIHLSRVAIALSAMANEPIAGNWANTPFNSLLSLLRPWWRQTSATDDQRLKLIDFLRRTASDRAWKLMMRCIDTRLLTASANATPKWREDNAGAPTANVNFRVYAHEIALRVLDDANGHLAGEERMDPREKTRSRIPITVRSRVDPVQTWSIRSRPSAPSQRAAAVVWPGVINVLALARRARSTSCCRPSCRPPRRMPDREAHIGICRSIV